ARISEAHPGALPLSWIPGAAVGLTRATLVVAVRHRDRVARISEAHPGALPLSRIPGAARGLTRATAASAVPVLHHPIYCPPFAARFAPVIQLASSGMKKPTA